MLRRLNLQLSCQSRICMRTFVTVCCFCLPPSTFNECCSPHICTQLLIAAQLKAGVGSAFSGCRHRPPALRQSRDSSGQPAMPTPSTRKLLLRVTLHSGTSCYEFMLRARRRCLPGGPSCVTVKKGTTGLQGSGRRSSFLLPFLDVFSVDTVS